MGWKRDISDKCSRQNKVEMQAVSRNTDRKPNSLGGGGQGRLPGGRVTVSQTEGVDGKREEGKREGAEKAERESRHLR